MSDPATATRRHAFLLGFMTLGEVDAFFAQLPITAVDASTPAEQWRRSREARSRLDAYVAGMPTPLPTELAPLAAEVQAREVFAKYYASQAEYEFAIVPIDSLLSPQVYADVQYVDELAATLPKTPDASADFSFAFPVPTITEPMISGQSVVFSSYGANVTANAVPSVTRRTDGTYDIVVRATSRPNYVQVARYDGRLVLINGVHKVLALRNAGRTVAACLLRSIQRREELGLAQNLSLNDDTNYKGVRPALVRDFLSTVAIPVLWRSTYTILRVVVQVEQIPAPAIPRPGTG